MPEKFVVTIPVKPYVKRFLSINYGEPVDFTSDPEANRFFQNLLKKPSTYRDKQYPDQFFTYTIKKDFYRNGMKDSLDFNNEIFNKIELDWPQMGGYTSGPE